MDGMVLGERKDDEQLVDELCHNHLLHKHQVYQRQHLCDLGQLLPKRQQELLLTL
jgi:hypothetical protein